jgi:hypothetical protein
MVIGMRTSPPSGEYSWHRPESTVVEPVAEKLVSSKLKIAPKWRVFYAAISSRNKKLPQLAVAADLANIWATGRR